MKNRFYIILAGVLLVASFVFADGGVVADEAEAEKKEPTISTLVSFKSILAEANDKVKLLSKQLATPDEYSKMSEKAIPQSAGVLACIAQAIVEHKGSAKAKVKGADLRVAALKIAELPDYEEAKKALAMAKEALAGDSSGEASKEANWAELVELSYLMTEVNQRDVKLSRAVRRLRRIEDAAKHANTLTVLAMVIHANNEYYGDDEEQGAEWKKSSMLMLNSMSEIGKAIEKKDEKAAKKFFTMSKDSCQHCHKAFDVD